MTNSSGSKQINSTIVQWLATLGDLQWSAEHGRASCYRAFIRATAAGIEKKEAVKQLYYWILRNTECLAEHSTLMGYANTAYRKSKEQ